MTRRNYSFLFSKLHWLMLMLILPMTATAPSVSHQCQQITIPMCTNIPYNKTLVPNYFNHETQVLAAESISEFWPLVENNCSPDVRFFLCSLYAPVCTILDMPIPPCQNFCKNVKSSCRRVMRQYNLSWPNSIKCNKFPHEEGLCVNSITEPLVSRVPLMTTSPVYSPEAFKGAQTDPSVSIDHCEPLQVPFCKDLPYNTTVLPNYFKHQTQDEAAVAVSAFSRLVECDCSPELKLFLCSLYAPVCTILDMPIPPCQSLCQSVKASCRRAMMQYDMLWPEYIRCDELPPKGDLCISSLMEYPNISLPNSTSTVPVISEITIDNHTAMPDNCEPVSIPLCKDIPYNTTIMPNILNHQTQADASLEINKLNPLVMMNCSPDLTLFLCSLYVPVCQGTGAPLPPCHNLCLSVVNGCGDIINREGSQLPQIFNCSKFPVKKNNDMCVDNSMLRTSPPPETSEFPTVTSPQINFKDQTNRHTMARDKCDPIIVPLCKDLPYNTTRMPNYFNHATQEYAGLEIHQYWPLIEINCSPDLKLFLCSLYLPPCNGQDPSVPPCRNLCLSAKSGCEEVMMTYGFHWPESLSCDAFPVSPYEEQCILGMNGNGIFIPSTVSSTISLSKQSGVISESQCEPITVELCKDLPYNTTMRPAIFDYLSQEEAGLELHQFYPLIKVQCSSDLKLFMCSAYLPVCSDQGLPILPCRSLCLSAKSGCEPLMRQFGFPWPESLNCDKFPESSHEERCISGMIGKEMIVSPSKFSTIPPPNHSEMASEIQCEPIIVDLCKDLPYSTTRMPNDFNHTTQESAGLEIHQFWPLVKLNCSPDLRLFLCSVYLPLCNDQGIPMPPCRNLCLSAKSGCEEIMMSYGFPWPESLACDKCPESSHEEHCISGMSEENITPSIESITSSPSRHTGMAPVSQCEPITVPLCKDLPYNTLMMPEHFNYLSQDDAGLEVHRHYPLIMAECSPGLQLFLCIAYVPICNSQGPPVLPCRKLCLSATTGCGSLMRRFGLQFPEFLDCDRFPDETNGDHCIIEVNESGVVYSNPKLPIVSPPDTSKQTHSTTNLDNFYGHCERITFSMCKDLPYNFTTLPNIMNHSTQHEAAFAIFQLRPIFQAKCSPDLQLMVCSIFLPPCSNPPRARLPCRDLCLSVRNGCEDFMNRHGVAWPSTLDCAALPDASQETCVGRVTSGH